MEQSIIWALWIIAFFGIIIWYFYKLEIRDNELMKMCADHETQTLYKCDK